MNDVNSVAKGLVDVLLDETAREDERDDAAIDLCIFDDDFVTRALVQVGRDPKVDCMVRERCGESLGAIWIRINKFDLESYNSLLNDARHEVYTYLTTVKPIWIDTYHLIWPPIIDDEMAKYLINILFDKATSENERKTAIIRLADSDSSYVESALVQAANDFKNESEICYLCGHALATIWVKQRKFDKKSYADLSKNAQCGVVGVLKYKKPRWIKRHNCLDLNK